MTWQPIETAPHQGFFLVCHYECDNDYECTVSVVWRDTDGSLVGYLDDGGEQAPYLDGPATHWMPLPQPPDIA